MPRNSSGVYSKPAGTTPTNGDDADATQFNLLMDDMTQALTDSLPRDGSAPMTGALAMGSNKITGLAAGTDAGDAVRFDQISGLAPKLVPAGAVIFHAGATAPTGYLKANGAAVSRTTYADLFAAIGTTYGAGDGSTTFIIPEFRGMFPRGWDDGRGIDIGRVRGTHQADAVQDHQHSASSSIDGGHTHSANTTVGSGGAGTALMVSNQSAAENPTARITINAVGGHTHTITVGNMSTGTAAAETRVKNVALLACIKY